MVKRKNLSGFLEFPFLFRDAISLRASDGNREAALGGIK